MNLKRASTRHRQYHRGRSNHDSVHDLPFLDRPIGSGFLDMRLDNISYKRITLVAAQNTDSRCALRARVISNIKNGTNL